MICLEKEKKEETLKWYDNGYFITISIIAIISLIIISSQSFVGGEVSFTLFSSIINHNSIYLLVLTYFILLQFPFGKKYFNYLNVFLIFVYFITSVTSFLTVIQSFTLITLLTFLLHFLLLIYLTHTFLRGTRFWTEFHLSSSPFNELTNDTFFYIISVIAVISLLVNLISTVVFSGMLLSILDTCYYLLLGRYIYLYYEFLERNKIDYKNDGNFDVVREKVQAVLDKTEVDDLIVEGFSEIKKMVQPSSESSDENLTDDTKEKKTRKKSTKKGEE